MKITIILASLPRPLGLEEGTLIMVTVGFLLLINSTQTYPICEHHGPPPSTPSSTKIEPAQKVCHMAEIIPECPLAVNKQTSKKIRAALLSMLISPLALTNKMSHSIFSWTEARVSILGKDPAWTQEPKRS